jgi:hypothetical protein
VYQQQQQQQQEEQQDAENPFLDPPFSRIKSAESLKAGIAKLASRYPVRHAVCVEKEYLLCNPASRVVIDRKRIFLFRPKTNIRQENAAEYSADNEYSGQGGKHRKNDNLHMEFFWRG